MLAWLSLHWVEVVACMVALKHAGELVARLTPGDKDDKLVAKVGQWLDRLSFLGAKPK